GLLNAQPMGFYPVSTLVHDAKRHGVEVRPPCLRTGSWDCTYEDHCSAPTASGALRIGWRFVRGIGDKVIDRMKEAWGRKPFTSIADVVERGGLNRGDVLAFAQADAFAAWAPDRRRAAWEALRAFGDVLPTAPGAVSQHDPVPVTREQLIFLDYHAVGMSIHGHPMESARQRLDKGGAQDRQHSDTT